MEKNSKMGKKLFQTDSNLNKQRTKHKCQLEADQFNDFFCSIGNNLDSNIKNNLLNLNSSKNITQTFFREEIEENHDWNESLQGKY